MSLREDSIRQYREKEAGKKAKQIEDKVKIVTDRIVFARVRICETFALETCPPLTVTPDEAVYWPKVTFEFEGIEFGYDLGRDRIQVKVACPKCGHDWYNVFSITTNSDGVRDLADLGYELCALDRHDCPADKPPRVPSPPPQTVTYRHGGVEHNLLDSIREYVDDRIEERMGDR